MVKIKWIFALAIATLSLQPVLAWRGSGTEAAPYEIRKAGDWRDLANEVMLGNSQRGVVFRLFDDFVVSDYVGFDADHPFEGTIEGDGHTLTFNAASSDSPSAVYDTAPFRYVRNATFHHLVVEGTIHTRAKYAAGFVGHVLGDSTTTFVGCTSNMVVVAHNNLSEAGHGGFVGFAEATARLRFERCVFGGQLLTTRENNNGTRDCGGFVGESWGATTMAWCVFDPQPDNGGMPTAIDTGGTFVRLREGATLDAADHCYHTQLLGAAQGTAVFDTIRMVDDGEATIVSEPTVELNGKSYWQSGALVRFSIADDTPFVHYLGVGCTLSDPWSKDGVHELRDVTDTPKVYVMGSMPDAKDEETVFGIKYRYLSANDYFLYTSLAACQQKGWYLNGNGYLCVKDGEGTEYYVTAIVGYDASQLQRTISGQWIWSDTQYEGTAVPVDLVTNFFHHTHLGVIAPRAFEGCGELKRLTFISDIDETQVYHNNLGLDLEIGERAFADCPHLAEIDMMYYNYTGNDHWETVGPAAVHHIAADAFEGSPQCRILVDPTEYQNYLSSDTWADHHSRIALYMASTEDMKVNGAVYSYMRNANNEPVKNNAAGHEALMQTLRYWNADYRQFLASDLLAEQDKKNIWYTQITGADADYLKSHDGVMRIYNDPGSYYNYKTIAIGANAFSGCTDLRAVEFWQTNGRSENCYAPLKIVIQNGAFAHCDNLREVRLYYYCQDGDDHWETLGPNDVVPGDNIFGTLTSLDDVSEEEYLASSFIPEGFRFVVSPARYQEFLDDPNWAKYGDLIVAADYEPTSWSPIETDGLVYDYASKTVNTASTNQVVTQNLSWWNLPIKIYEIITLYEAAKDMMGLVSSLKTAFKNFKAEMTRNFNSIGKGLEDMDKDLKWLNNLDPKAPDLDYMYYKEDAANEWLYPQAKGTSSMVEKGIIEWNKSKRYAFTAKSRELLTNDPVLFEEFRDVFRAGINHFRTTSKAFWDASVKQAIYTLNVATRKAFKSHFMFIDLGIANAYPSFWALGSDMSEEQFQRGLVENIKANIHNVSYENTLVYTPDKKLVYHMYVQKPSKQQDSITIYNDVGRAYNYRTVAIKRDAFQGNQTLRSVAFAENAVAGSDSYVPMLLAIPDSAFAGCSRLERLYLTYKTRNGGVHGLGPENFILGGDSIFAGCDSTKFRIVIDIERKQDFLDDEMWRGYERFFTYTDVQEAKYDSEYGVNYALYYDNNTTQRVSRVSGHKIEHLTAISADDEFLRGHQGSMGLMNDIGTYNNYKLDLVKKRAFKGNPNIRAVSFWDLKGGDAYTTLDLDLGDSCFVGCTNLANIDMLHCVTDGDDHIELLRPGQVRAGRGMLDGTNARIKMTPRQADWFANDSAWARYADRFMPCIIQPCDEGVKRALKGMDYYTPCNSPYHWTDYFDLARIGGAGFSWLDGRFREQADRLCSFPDFQYFGSVGLDYVGQEWFHGCALLSNILLPETISRIEGAAFEGCSSLEDIELPAAVEFIGGRAFFGCTKLKTIVVRGTTPARTDSNPFPYNEGMRICVPAGTEAAYRAAWPDYAAYIVGGHTDTKHVTTTKKGELAERLGLTVETSFSGLFYGKELYRLHGNYAKYDSLTVSGPLDDLDLSVLRYLAGRDSYHNKGGEPTDGRLRYLDLSGAQIRKGSDYNYVYLGNGTDILRNAVSADDEIPRALFYKCDALETLILPRSAKDVRIEAFNAPNLKRIAFTNDGDLQYNHLMGGFMGRATTLLSAPLDELVFLTGKAATSATSNPWGQRIGSVYAYNTLLGDYAGHDDLAQVAGSIDAPFADDAVTVALMAHELYFPSQYLAKESVEGIFADDNTITHLEDFYRFDRVRTLEAAFAGCTRLQRIALPGSLEAIGRDAFARCASLDTIYVGCDSVPALAEGAFDDLPADFRILVPKSHVKRYREQWAQYADHIMVDGEYYDHNDILTVTLTEPNTLDKALGLQMSYTTHIATDGRLWPTGMTGHYGGVRRLKVVGPISGGDIALLRHMAGFTPWSKSRNFLGHLEYLDLYDARLVASKYEFAQDKYGKPDIFNPGKDLGQHVVSDDNVLPTYAFLKCYALKTLILPRTCSEVKTRALQECENLETLVVGERMQTFNWDALDDCASMVRLYLLGDSKLKITSEFAVWRWLCNNYNPTFDAFYVRPSLYNAYVSDDAYTSSSWQRTNNIQTGVFDSDEEFCAFAAHAAATAEDLAAVSTVEGWFDGHAGIRDLTALAYTSVDTLSKATLAPLTQLERIALPATLEAIGEGALAGARGLRYADFLLCDSTLAAARLRDGGLARLGIDTQQTLVYVPEQYGDTDETNVVVERDGGLSAKTFRLVDRWDYCVPHEFEAERVENTRVLGAGHLYTACLPYDVLSPTGARAYQLDRREGTELVFKAVTGNRMDALTPYLLDITGSGASLGTELRQTLPASDGLSTKDAGRDKPLGYILRGTLQPIDNATAHALGAYIMQPDNRWHAAPAGEPVASIPPFRAYLLPAAGSSGANTLSTSLVDEATGITTLRTIDADGTERVYDLQGRPVGGGYRGIVVKNGKKQIMK